jgi:hypothetical protein
MKQVVVKVGPVANLYLRGRSLVWRREYRGKQIIRAIPVRRLREEESGPPADLVKDAVAWMKAAEGRLLRGEYDKLMEETARRREVGTVGELVAEYERVCRENGEPRQATVDANCAAMRRFVRVAAGKLAVDGMSLSVLSKESLRAFQAAKLKELGDKDSTRRTIASTLRQVRSLVQPRLIQDYKVRCPDLREFREYYLGRVPMKDVPLPPYPLRLATARAARRLWLRRDPLYLVWLMAYGLGMRADEMACARWTWIETHMGAPRMALRDRPEEDFRVKGVRPGNVPVHAAVLRRLLAFKAEGSTFILPRDGYIGRVNLIQRDFSAWMTSLGWDKVDTSKRAHELRRLFGSRVWAKHGKEECFVRMRHMSFSTTERSYLNMNLDLTRRELVGI